MKKFLHIIAERIRSLREGQAEVQAEVMWDQTEVRVEWLNVARETCSVSFPWKAVSAVDTFKRDLFAVDCICLAFETPDGWIEVGEDMKGWDAFLAAVESSLPGFPPREKWWRKTMIPAFEANHSRLWTRGKQDG